MNIERKNGAAWIGLGIVLLGLLALSAMGSGMLGHFGVGYGARPLMGVGPWLWGVGLVGLVMRIAVWGAVIVLVVTVLRRSSALQGTDVRRSQVASLEILKRRYAAGEINREQFEEMRRVLETTAGAQ